MSGSIAALAFIYFIYLLAIWRVLEASQEWALVQINQGGVYVFALNAIDFIIFKVGIYGVVLAFAGGAISYWMTKPEILDVVDLNNSEFQSE